jgi:hypothetical protein
MVSGGAVKERKGWESSEKKEGIEEEDSSLHLGPEREPGKICCCVLLFRL